MISEAYKEAEDTLHEVIERLVDHPDVVDALIAISGMLDEKAQHIHTHDQPEPAQTPQGEVIFEGWVKQVSVRAPNETERGDSESVKGFYPSRYGKIVFIPDQEQQP